MSCWGIPRKDLDLLVTGIPQPDLLHCLRPYGRVQLTGRAFGVIKLLPHGWDGPPIVVALPRTEISTGVGHRDFEVMFDHTLPVETDLGRRDFTINAMAIDLADGHLLDPFWGYGDLQQRQLRQVSPLAFPEDPLRMLRGVSSPPASRLQIETATPTCHETDAATIALSRPSVSRRNSANCCKRGRLHRVLWSCTRWAYSCMFCLSSLAWLTVERPVS